MKQRVLTGLLPASPDLWSESFTLYKAVKD
jgi:hypothetical protein